MNGVVDVQSHSEKPRLSKFLAGMLKTLIGMVIVGVLMLLSAGPRAFARWPMAWVYLIYIFVYGLAISLAIDPGLMKERSRIVPEIKSWDKPLVAVIVRANPLATYLLPGLDRRFGWSPVLPLWLEVAGAAALALGMGLTTWAMLENRFFTQYVRIQKERGQTVITTGPYRLVRHPGYLAGILMFLGTPFMLGSLWTLIPEVLTILVLLYRTAREDATLKEELAGYQEYAQQTRYRLLPGVW
jgi:protein-S-isoprenylcysteine O-methyltransferase Ste14